MGKCVGVWGVKGGVGYVGRVYETSVEVEEKWGKCIGM